MPTAHNRGHKVYYDFEKEKWLYGDDNSDGEIERPCIRCGNCATKEGHDYCLKDLSTCKYINNACCGHGVDAGYIQLKDGRMFRGEKMINDGIFNDDFFAPISIYHKRSQELRKFIQTKLDIDDVKVSRSSVGNTQYYNVEITGDLSPWTIEDLFKGISTGLVQYDMETDYHMYLIDEEELHKKYLASSGKLVFPESFSLTELDFYDSNRMLRKVRDRLAKTNLKIKKVGRWDEYLLIKGEDLRIKDIRDVLSYYGPISSIEAHKVYAIKNWS